MWRHHKALELQPPAAAPTLATKIRAKVPGMKAVLNAPHLKDDSEMNGDDLLRFGVFGTPDDCVERLREFEDAGVRNILCSFTYGGMPAERVRETMRLFAKEVMPAVQGAAVHG
jgi:alkanesulfonate monooxygenase SsuD/methylene tetrahydromethanopterin reductase-like flavin-dependent oxidoreductase (luciferase family)